MKYHATDACVTVVNVAHGHTWRQAIVGRAAHTIWPPSTKGSSKAPSASRSPWNAPPNILTRSLNHFRPGFDTAAHPYLLDEMKAVQKPGHPEEGLKALRQGPCSPHIAP